MSVLDDLSNLEARVRDRMRELRPLLDEYRELEQVAQRLGVNPDEDAPAAERTPGDEDSSSTSQPSARRRSRPSSQRKAGSGQRRRSQGEDRSQQRRQPGGSNNGARREQVLAAVRERPGLTVRDVAEQLGVDPTSLYRVVAKLESDGALRKDGRELQPTA